MITGDPLVEIQQSFSVSPSPDLRSESICPQRFFGIERQLEFPEFEYAGTRYSAHLHSRRIAIAPLLTHTLEPIRNRQGYERFGDSKRAFCALQQRLRPVLINRQDCGYLFEISCVLPYWESSSCNIDVALTWKPPQTSVLHTMYKLRRSRCLVQYTV